MKHNNDKKTQVDLSQYERIWHHPEVEHQVEAGIREHRMGDLVFSITDAQGRRVRNLDVTVEQVEHDFRFGANIFLLGNAPEDDPREQKYRQTFRELLNAATTPLYWRDLEPEPGQLRFGTDSPFVYRRPPVDPVLAFAEEAGLTINGHCLVWDQPDLSIPSWLPTDMESRKAALRKRIRELAEAYGERIPCWDVVNELVYRFRFAESVPMPDDFGLWSFLEAQQIFPDSASLMINDQAWGQMTERYENIIRHMLDGGAKLSGIGQQFHLFDTRYVERVLRGEAMPSIDFKEGPLPVMPEDVVSPENIWNTLDSLGRFKVPVHISEVTLPALADSQEGREIQAMMVRDFYRLWFSHPSVNWITWWNLVDNAGLPPQENIPSENLLSGLLSETYEPKPAYEALMNLIHHEWKTHKRVSADEDGYFRIRAFYGQYRIHVKGGGVQNDYLCTHTQKGSPPEPFHFPL